MGNSKKYGVATYLPMYRKNSYASVFQYPNCLAKKKSYNKKKTQPCGLDCTGCYYYGHFEPDPQNKNPTVKVPSVANFHGNPDWWRTDVIVPTPYSVISIWCFKNRFENLRIVTRTASDYHCQEIRFAIQWWPKQTIIREIMIIRTKEWHW